MTDRVGLRRVTATLDRRDDVELVEGFDELEGLTRDHARGLALEVLVGRVTVDGHHARAGHDPNASNGGLSLTSGVGAVVSGAHDQAFAFAFFFWVGLGIGTGFCAACGWSAVA